VLVVTAAAAAALVTTTMMMMMMMIMMMMMMMIIPFGQLGLWAPSAGVRDVFTSTAYVFTNLSHGGFGTSSVRVGSTV
jgi:hypothetical protein